MKKKWNVLTIVSLILIVAEIVVFFVLILPSMRMSGIFSALEKADGEKCERCWTYSTTVGEDKDYPTLCHRCSEVMHQIERN